MRKAMKRKTVIFLAVMLALCVCGIAFASIQCTKTVRSFDLGDYQAMIEQFPSEKVLGRIGDADNLRQRAEEAWVEIYGESVREEKPYIVSYDEANGVWLVSGSLRPFSLGGTAQMLVENDTGKVLAVWHNK